MKLSILLLLCFILDINVNQAQIEQKGIVLDGSRAGKTLKGVNINAENAVATSSNSDGIFYLNFRKGKEGDIINFLEVTKTGYSVVNGRFLEKIVLSTRRDLEIVMASTDVFEKVQRDFYHVIIAVNENKGQEFSQKDQDRIFKEGWNLSKYISEMSLDNPSLIQQQALKFVLQKKIDSAISILNPSNLRRQLCTDDSILNIFIKKRQFLSDSILLKLNNKKNEHGKSILMCGRFFLIVQKLDSAYNCYKTFLDHNKNDESVIFEMEEFLTVFGNLKIANVILNEFYKTATNFGKITTLVLQSTNYERMHLYENQLKALQKAKQLSSQKSDKLSIPQKILNLFLNIGFGHYYNHKVQFELSNTYYFKAFNQYDSLPMKVKLELMDIMPDLLKSSGDNFRQLGDTTNAKIKFLGAIFLYEHRRKFPRPDMANLNLIDLVGANLTFASYLQEIGEDSEAYNFFEDALILVEKLMEFNKYQYYSNKAQILGNFGNLLEKMPDKIDSSILLYKLALKIREDTAVFPDLYDIRSLGYITNNLGVAYYKKFFSDYVPSNSLDSSRKYLIKSEYYRKQLYDSDSISFEFEYSSTFHNRAITELALGNYDLAFIKMNKAIFFRQEIIHKLPIQNLAKSKYSKSYINSLCQMEEILINLYNSSLTKNSLIQLKNVSNELKAFINLSKWNVSQDNEEQMKLTESFLKLHNY